MLQCVVGFAGSAATSEPATASLSTGATDATVTGFSATSEITTKEVTSAGTHVTTAGLSSTDVSREGVTSPETTVSAGSPVSLDVTTSTATLSPAPSTATDITGVETSAPTGASVSVEITTAQSTISSPSPTATDISTLEPGSTSDTATSVEVTTAGSTVSAASLASAATDSSTAESTIFTASPAAFDATSAGLTTSTDLPVTAGQTTLLQTNTAGTTTFPGEVTSGNDSIRFLHFACNSITYPLLHGLVFHFISNVIFKKQIIEPASFIIRPPQKPVRFFGTSIMFVDRFQVRDFQTDELHNHLFNS